MGVCAEISFDTFPEQGGWVGKRVTVCFHYDTSKPIGGEIIRDDLTAPHRMVIRLDDGRVVLSDECQYQVLPGGPFRAS